jgi:hypothetical protein
VPEQRLQSRILVPNHPSAREYLGLVQVRDPDDLSGAGKTGIEITEWGKGHSISEGFATMERPDEECNRADRNSPHCSPPKSAFYFAVTAGSGVGNESYGATMPSAEFN